MSEGSNNINHIGNRSALCRGMAKGKNPGLPGLLSSGSFT